MAKRKVSMGSIEKIGERRWRIRVRLGWDPDKKRYIRSPSRTVTGSKADAREELRKYRDEIIEKMEHPERAISFREYANENYDVRVAEGGSPLARIRERNETDKCIELYGDYALGDITTRLIKQTNAKVKHAASMSPQTLFRVNRRLKAILKASINDGILDDNPAEGVVVEKPDPKPSKALSIDEARRLAESIETEELSMIGIGIRLLLASGARKGEILALNWENVDFKRNAIHIEFSYSNDKERRKPKTKSSNRWVTLDDVTMNMLDRWKKAQPSHIVVKGFEQTEATPVISAVSGQRCDPTNFSRAFRDFCVRNGFGTYDEVKTYVDSTGRKRTLGVGYKGLTPHALRHTQATLLIGNGTDLKAVSGRLGHASVSTTTEIYADFIEENDIKAANDFGKLLNGKSE